MCLGVPGQIITISGKTASVDFWGTRKPVKLDILEEPVAEGDYIIDHCGYAIRRIKPEEVVDTMMMYETVLVETDIFAESEEEKEVELV